MDYDVIVKQVGKRIKMLREKNNETQKELGKAIGISQDAISNIETGKTQLTFENQLRIAEHFNVSHDFLCKDIDNNSILDLLKKYVHLKVESTSIEPERFKYPVLVINKNFYRYLVHTAYAEDNLTMPEKIRKQWIEEEIQIFYKSDEIDEEAKKTEEAVLLPVNLIIPDDKKAEWHQSDLLRELSNDWLNAERKN